MNGFRDAALLTPRHHKQAAKFVDLPGEAECLSLQHAHRVALVPLLYQFGDPLVERGQFAEQAVKLPFDRRPPGLLNWVNSDRNGFLFLGTHS
jgi:hypothetical protein